MRVAAPSETIASYSPRCSEFRDGDGSEKDKLAGVAELFQEYGDVPFTLSPFRASLMTFVSIK